MLPGQVRECYNGFPDATYGLTKRPGFKHIANLETTFDSNKAKWFYINRDDNEVYVGRIHGGSFGFAQYGTPGIRIWNAVTGIEATVTYETGTQTYFQVPRDNLKVITVQDTSIVINTSQVVAASSSTSPSASVTVAASVGALPTTGTHDEIRKVVNTTGVIDDYFVKFVADNGSSGSGYWEETIGPNISLGVDNTTMPHELINTGLNTFHFQKITYTDRLVGDATSNSDPSFVGEKITNGFFSDNRLGFLSKDNVSLSQAGDFFNFYFKSAQTTIDSDPVDISCSSIKPTALHSVLPTAQGVVLFSAKQQFILYSESGVLTPGTANIRAISNYEMNSTIDPVDVGTNINFISKTPGYTRVFSMVTRGQEASPQVLDLSRVVKEWVAPGIDQLVASPQNSMIALAGQESRELYIYRYYNDGQENLMEAWTSWVLPGEIQFCNIDQDDMYMVIEYNPSAGATAYAGSGQIALVKAALSQSPEEAILVNSQREKVNPCMDYYAIASSVSYDAVNDLSKCYLPYNDIDYLNPVLIIKGGTDSGDIFDSDPIPLPLNDLVESGFTITPERGKDGTGDYFIVPHRDITSIATDVVVGYKYNFDMQLPKTYFRPSNDQSVTDYTANLTLHRMKFSVGLSGIMSFKVKQKGKIPYELDFVGDGTTQNFQFNRSELDYVEQKDVKVSIDGVRTVDFQFQNDTTIRINSGAPALNSKIKFYIDEWFAVYPSNEANDYLANDIPMSNQQVYTLPLHQKTENVDVRVFNNSPFPVALNGMMWEGNYTPRFYGRK